MSKKQIKKFPINLYILPLAFVLGILPFIIHLKEYDPKLQYTGWFGLQAMAADIFLYYKQVFFIAVSVIMVCLIILQCFLKQVQIKFTKIFIPLAGYALLSTISSIASEYSYFSFHGIFEQMQSLWVLLGYALLVYYSFLFVTEIKDVSAIMSIFTVSTIIMLLLGLSQAFSHDFIRSSLAAKIILPAEYQDLENPLAFTFSESTVYLTLYNPNYVGSYVSLISPIFLMQIFTKKKVWSIVLNALMYVGLLLTLLGSGSRAGLSGVVASLIVLAVLYGKKVFKYWMEIIILLILIIGTVYTMNNYSNNSIFNRVKSALEIEEKTYNLASIETNKDDVVIDYKGNKLKLVYAVDEETANVTIFLIDENNVSLGYRDVDDYYVPDDPRFDSIKIQVAVVEGYYGMILTIDRKPWYFAKINGSMYNYTPKACFVKLYKAPEFEPLAKYPKLASNRGFIWSRTIPFLKNYIFLGSGADTFSLIFPNGDLVAMYNNGFENEIMTKPHNMYLQIATETGVLSLICFLAFYFWYFASSVRLYYKSDRSKYSTQIGMGILSGTFGYMVVAFINDSMITVAPLYWALIGIGISINFIIKKENNIVDASPLVSSPSDVKADKKVNKK